MEDLQNLINNSIENPEQILNKETSESLKEHLKYLHDILLKNSDKLKQKNENLIIKHTDNDQIWEQLKLHLDILNK